MLEEKERVIEFILAFPGWLDGEAVQDQPGRATLQKEWHRAKTLTEMGFPGVEPGPPSC